MNPYFEVMKKLVKLVPRYLPYKELFKTKFTNSVCMF